MDEQPTKSKRVITPEQRAAMAEGKRKAKERREREKAEKLKQEEDLRRAELENKKLQEALRRKNVADAERAQQEMLDNYERDKANKARLKENFKNIKAKIMKEAIGEEVEPEPPVTEEKALEPELTEEEIEENEPQTTGVTFGTTNEDDMNTYLRKVNEISQQLPDPHTQALFKEVCDVYDFNKSLGQNVGLLMKRANEVINNNAAVIRNRVQAQKVKEMEDEEKKRQEEKTKKMKEARKRLNDLMRL
jgi:hypothetical protein